MGCVVGCGIAGLAADPATECTDIAPRLSLNPSICDCGDCSCGCGSCDCVCESPLCGLCVPDTTAPEAEPCALAGCGVWELLPAATAGVAGVAGVGCAVLAVLAGVAFDTSLCSTQLTSDCLAVARSPCVLPTAGARAGVGDACSVCSDAPDALTATGLADPAAAAAVAAGGSCIAAGARLGLALPPWRFLGAVTVVLGGLADGFSGDSSRSSKASICDTHTQIHT